MGGHSDRRRMLRVSILLALAASAVAVALLASAPSAASAFDEPRVSPDPTRGTCWLVCHQNPDGSNVSYEDGPTMASCEKCHSPYGHHSNFPWGNNRDAIAGREATQGPHARYSATTDRCATCHTLHAGTGSYKLLPADSLSGACFACHDGTGGGGVYGAIKARTGADPTGGHPVVSTSTVPGGDASTGATSSMTFRGPGGALGCSDCHSVHGNNLVAPYKGDRLRVTGEYIATPYSARLLRQRPTGGDTTVTVYGSDWCMACHKGRSSGGAIHNHPVDSLLVTATPLYYNRIVITDALAVGTYSWYGGYGPLGGIDDASQGSHGAQQWRPNTGYLMPYPRLPRQAGHAPICQQCHEDTRDPGYLSADGTAAVVATSSESVLAIDGTAVPGKMLNNPRFQNFPHETENDRMVIETGDDLCLNCHPPVVLP